MKTENYILLGMLFLISCAHLLSKHPADKNINAEAVNSTRHLTTDSSFAPDRFRKQFEQGIDFLATGNEPFWSIEIDFDKYMHFKIPGGIDITTPAVEGARAADADIMRYRAVTEKAELIVQIRRMECVNDMSGEKLACSVTIDVKANNENGYTTYKGCGRYLADSRLHDIWVLETINHNPVKATDFGKGLPQLEFNLTEKRIFGSTGCNNINTTIDVLGKKIHFGRIASTRMACPNMDFESGYLKKLENKTIPYQIKPGKLYLQVSPDSVFVYKKVD